LLPHCRPTYRFLFAPVVTSLVVLFWTLYLHPRFMLKNRLKIEMFGYVVRAFFIFWFLDLKLFLLNIMIGGTYIFTNFSLSHTHTPVVAHNEHPNWVEYAAHHTVNVSPTWVVTWWMGYLNFQIEHHLFPSMPQVNHPLISSRVRDLFLKHKLPYEQITYWEGLKKTFLNLHKVGN